jgi:hypothetical protein
MFFGAASNGLFDRILCLEKQGKDALPQKGE